MNFQVLLVPYDSGHCRARMGRGPEQLLNSSLKPLFSQLGHTLAAEEVTIGESYPAEISTAFALCRKVAQRVRACRADGAFPIVLSGNCNIAVGAIAGCGPQNTSMIWFDAHGECTTPDTTASGFLDGMGISILTGQSWRKLALSIPEFTPLPGARVLLVGSRDVEPDESATLDRIGVVRVAGLRNLLPQLQTLSSDVDGVYVHIDLDVLNPSEAVANQWATPGGLTIEELKSAVKAIQERTTIKALGIASYDPEHDREGKALTATSAVAQTLFSNASRFPSKYRK